jgi:hypothetical protein
MVHVLEIVMPGAVKQRAFPERSVIVADEPLVEEEAAAIAPKARMPSGISMTSGLSCGW